MNCDTEIITRMAVLPQQPMNKTQLLVFIEQQEQIERQRQVVRLAGTNVHLNCVILV